jgi:hypothetical protein
MFTSDNYFNITNAHILNENVNHLVEREHDEPGENRGRQIARDNRDFADPNSPINRNIRKAAAQKAARAGLKAKGKVPTKGGKPMFEAVAEYLFVEGYADNVKSAEVMAMNISETWVNEILENN